MKRATSDRLAQGWRYGCPSWTDEVVDEATMQQLRMALSLRNDLAGAERRYEVMKDALWLSFPEVAQAQAAAEQTAEKVEAVEKEIKQQRSINQSTVPAPDEKRRLAQARREKAAAARSLNKVKARLKPQMQQRRAELDAAKKCAQGECASLRRCAGEACKPECHHRCPDPAMPRLRDRWMARGLGWGTYAAVHDEFAAAKQRIREQRKEWRPGEPWPRVRIHDWDGKGTVTVQVQLGRKNPQWELVHARPAEEWLGRDRSVHEQLGPKRKTLRVQVARGWWIELPVQVHRPLPADAQIKYVKLTRRLVGGHVRWSVAFTLRRSKPPTKVNGDVLALRLHWDSGVNGSVAVASIAGAELPPPPHDVAHLVRRVGYGRYELHASPVWRALLARDDRVRSVRDELLHDDDDPSLRPAVVAALRADPELAQRLGVTAGQAAHPRNTQQWFAKLVERWPAGDVVDADLHAMLRQRLQEHYSQQRLAGLSTLALWRMRDRHLLTFELSERDQVVQQRRNAWCNAAAWLCDAAAFIAVDGRDLAEVRRRPDLAQEDPYAARGDRRLQVAAAPGELRAAIESAASQRGVRINYAGKEIS